MIVLAAFVAFLGVVCFVYGVRNVVYKEKNISRFMLDRYNASQDMSVVKKERKSFDNKSILMAIAGGLICGGTTFTVVGIPWMSLVSCLAGLAVPGIFAKWHEASRKKLIINQLEMAAEIMGAAVNSGIGLPAALEKAAQEIGSPLNSELMQVSSEIRLGISSGEAFQNLADRIKLPELNILSTAVNLQQSGMAVNMGAVLSQVQDNLNEKKAFEEEVNAITVENRMSGYIVGVMPFLVVGVVRQIAPDFIAPMFNTTIGLTVFFIATAVILFGIYWMYRMGSSLVSGG